MADQTNDSTLTEKVDMTAACFVSGLVDRATAENFLTEVTGISPTLCASMLASAVLDMRAAERTTNAEQTGDDWVPYRDWDGRWTR